MVCIGILFSFHVFIPYSVPQYVCSGLVLFVFAEVLEGDYILSDNCENTYEILDSNVVCLIIL